MWIVKRQSGIYGYIKYIDALQDIHRINIKWNGLFYVKN